MSFCSKNVVMLIVKEVRCTSWERGEDRAVFIHCRMYRLCYPVTGDASKESFGER